MGRERAKRPTAWKPYPPAGGKQEVASTVGNPPVYWQEVEDDKRNFPQNPLEKNKSFTKRSFFIEN